MYTPHQSLESQQNHRGVPYSSSGCERVTGRTVRLYEQLFLDQRGNRGPRGVTCASLLNTHTTVLGGVAGEAGERINMHATVLGGVAGEAGERINTHATVLGGVAGEAGERMGKGRGCGREGGRERRW